MNNKIFSYFEIAAKTAISKNDRRNFIVGAIGIRDDGVMVKALNSPTEAPNRLAHAEAKLSNKLDYGATVYVCRIRFDTYGMALARPCGSCMRILQSKRVKKIYYSISSNEYGVINL